MANRLKIILVFVLLFFIFVLIHAIKKDNISIKYSLIWLASTILMIIMILIPNLLESLSHLLGFELTSNMIFMIAIIILFIISFLFTIIVSRQTQKIRLLIQELSLLKDKVNQMEKKNKGV